MDPQRQRRERSRLDEMAAVLSTLNILNAQAERRPRLTAVPKASLLKRLPGEEVGEEQSRRLAQAVETERPCLLPTEVATTGPPRSSTDEVEPKAPAKVIPAARVPPRPALVHIAPCGKVWHADASCRHLYHRGHRRAQVRAVALTKLRKGSDFPPCRDCSAAWLDATPSPRTSGLQATQK